MQKDIFIPHNVEELYEKMICENFTGKLLSKDDRLIWCLPNGITVKVAVDERMLEGYIDTSCCCGGKEHLLTHWHPMKDEIYNDLLKIDNGEIFWVKKKQSIFNSKGLPIIMDKNEWEALSERQKSKYNILGWEY